MHSPPFIILKAQTSPVVETVAQVCHPHFNMGANMNVTRQILPFFALSLVVGNVQAQPELTMILLSPEHPETSYYRIEQWPSFIFMPGAPLFGDSRITMGSTGSYSPGLLGGDVTGVSPASYNPSAVSNGSSYPFAPSFNGVDIDCAQLGGPVRVGAADPHNLDADGDGIGCQ
jgi:hypothetical protein